MARSLIPFPRVKFFTTTFSPLSFLTPPPSPSPSRATQQTPCATQETHAYNAMTLAEIAQGLFHPSNAVVSCDLRMGQCLTGAAFFRGNLDYGAAERQMYSFFLLSSSFLFPLSFFSFFHYLLSLPTSCLLLCFVIECAYQNTGSI